MLGGLLYEDRKLTIDLTQVGKELRTPLSVFKMFEFQPRERRYKELERIKECKIVCALKKVLLWKKKKSCIRKGNII